MGSGLLKTYLWQPVITSPVIQQTKVEKHQPSVRHTHTRSVELKPWTGGPKSYLRSGQEHQPSVHYLYTLPSVGNQWQMAVPVSHTDESQSGWNSCLWLFHPWLDDWRGDLPQIGLWSSWPLFSSTHLVRLVYNPVITTVCSSWPVEKDL